MYLVTPPFPFLHATSVLAAVTALGWCSAPRAVVAAQWDEKTPEAAVVMSREHRETCLVFLNDALPDGLLPDPQGTERAIGKSLGRTLTVVMLWNRDDPYAFDQFRQIQRELIPWAEHGVRIIAIHVGAPPDDYQALCERWGEGVLCLLDADEEYFRQVATRKLPRTYVLDARGTIVWLDIEYSRSTRHDLRTVLRSRTRPTP
jgi:hypothetical protein